MNNSKIYPGGSIEIGSESHKKWTMNLYNLLIVDFVKKKKLPRKLKKKLKKRGKLLIKFTDENLGISFIDPIKE